MKTRVTSLDSLLAAVVGICFALAAFTAHADEVRILDPIGNVRAKQEIDGGALAVVRVKVAPGLGTSVADIMVVLETEAAGKGAFAGKTDQHGLVEFPNVPAGTYIAEVRGADAVIEIVEIGQAAAGKA